MRWIGFLNVAKADTNLMVNEIYEKDFYGKSYIVMFRIAGVTYNRDREFV